MECLVVRLSKRLRQPVQVYLPRLIYTQTNQHRVMAEQGLRRSARQRSRQPSPQVVSEGAQLKNHGLRSKQSRNDHLSEQGQVGAGLREINGQEPHDHQNANSHSVRSRQISRSTMQSGGDAGEFGSCSLRSLQYILLDIFLKLRSYT